MQCAVHWVRSGLTLIRDDLITLPKTLIPISPEGGGIDPEHPDANLCIRNSRLNVGGNTTDKQGGTELSSVPPTDGRSHDCHHGYETRAHSTSLGTRFGSWLMARP